jgi:formamidopyrimidine-DNA glycosylase
VGRLSRRSEIFLLDAKERGQHTRRAMPELPEVEVVRLRLCEAVVNRRIAEVHTARANYAFLTAPGRLKSKLQGRRITEIERRGKYLLFLLDDQSRLLVHLGMTGQLFTSHAVSPRLYNKQSRAGLDRKLAQAFVPDKHTHLSISFTDRGEQLHFRDTRKFGKLLWLAKGKTDPRLERLGVDALSITPEHLAQSASHRRIAIKSLLLDQAVLAGVGNIYADEALYQARILPERSAASLSLEETRVLAPAVRKILARAIVLGGSSVDDYVHPDGSDGGFQNTFAVYGRDGEPCHRCRTPIVRVVIGQRSSHFCASCQC